MRGEEVGKDQGERMSTRERVRRREASGRGGKDREVRGRQRRKHEKWIEGIYSKRTCLKWKFFYIYDQRITFTDKTALIRVEHVSKCWPLPCLHHRTCQLIRQSSWGCAYCLQSPLGGAPGTLSTRSCSSAQSSVWRSDVLPTTTARNGNWLW